MQDKKNEQNQDNNIQMQNPKFSEQKNQPTTEKAGSDLPDTNDEDGDEDENHYDDSIEKK